MLSRRKIVKGSAVAVVSVGVGALTTAAADPAAAATQAAAVASAAVVPAVVNLTDAGTIAVDASLGNDFRVTINGDRMMGTPVNPSNGQQVIFQVTQGSAGSFTLTWSSGYEFSAAMPRPTLSTAAGRTDLLGFIYSAAKGTWLFVAFANGFD